MDGSKLAAAQGRCNEFVTKMKLDREKMLKIQASIMKTLQTGLQSHKTQPLGSHSLPLLDTHLSELPTGKEAGHSYVLGIGAGGIYACKVELRGASEPAVVEVVSKKLTDPEFVSESRPGGLADVSTPCSKMLEAACRLLEGILEDKDRVSRVALCAGFPLSQKSMDHAVLMRLKKNMRTGQHTDDPLEGNDLVLLFNVTFERLRIPAKVVICTNDTVAALYCGALEKPKHMPRCIMGVALSLGANVSYVQPNSKEFGYKGAVINTEVGNFVSDDLPLSVVDFEVGFSLFGHDSLGTHSLENMISAVCMPEICRTLVLRVFQRDAPSPAWQLRSLSLADCEAILNDTSSKLSVTSDVLESVWDWDTSREVCQIVRQLFFAAWERAAKLVAVAIAAFAKQTGRLQPALGGLTTAIFGDLYNSERNPEFCRMVRESLNTVFDQKTESLIYILEIGEVGVFKGAGVMSVMEENNL